MTLKQNLPEPSKEEIDLKIFIQTAKSTKSKSFRSKMFEKKTTQQIPKIRGKQISLHNARYKQYRQSDLKMFGRLQVPQIWGCITPQTRKVQSSRKNYLKRDIDIPTKLFSSYIKRKSRLLQRSPMLKRNSELSYSTPVVDSNSQQSQYQSPEEEVAHFFTELQSGNKVLAPDPRLKFNNTVKQKVKRYSEQETPQLNYSKFFKTQSTKPACISRFIQMLQIEQGYMKSQLLRRIDSKSVYEMSLDQLKERIISKKKLLRCLNQGISGGE